MFLGLLFLIVPVAGGLLILAVRAWRDEMARRKQHLADLKQQAEELERQRHIQAARLEPDQRLINRRGLPRAIGRGLIGHHMFIGTGTYGQNMLQLVLRQCELNGQQQLVGSVLLIQNNASERSRFLQEIPACFHSRVVFGSSPSFTGGMANRPIAEVMAHVDRWAGPFVQASHAVCSYHERETHRVPGQIVLFWSEGGQAPVAVPVIEVIHSKFPDTQIIGITSLPAHGRNRRKFHELKAWLEDEAHGIAGWLVTDSLLQDWKSADYCAAGLLVTLSDAQIHDDEAVQLNNVLSLAFTERPGSVLVLEYLARDLPAFPWQVEGYTKGFYIAEQRLVEAVQTALRAVEDGQGRRTLNFPVGEPGTSVFDMVMVNVGYDAIHERDDIQLLTDHIHEGYRQRLRYLERNGGRAAHPGMFYGLGNYSLKFGTLVTYIDEHNPTCRMVITRLTAVKNGYVLTEEMSHVPDDLKLPYEQKSLPSPPPDPSTPQTFINVNP